MKKLFFILLTGMAILVSCKQKDKTTDGKSETTDRGTDSAAIRNTVIGFYTWYSKHDTVFNKYDLYSGIKKEDEPPYKINWDEVEKYQAFIRDSVPELGDTFLQNQKRLFQKCDSAFKVDVNDDIPYFFDFDWYTNTQEDPAYLLEEIIKSKQWFITINGDEAIVDIKGFDEDGTKPAATVINLIMKKENGQWTIAKTWTD
jgi:hypothetical protein